MLNDYMKQNGNICTFQNLKTFFVSLFYLDFIKPTNVSDHFAGPCRKSFRALADSLTNRERILTVNKPAAKNACFALTEVAGLFNIALQKFLLFF